MMRSLCLFGLILSTKMFAQDFDCTAANSKYPTYHVADQILSFEPNDSELILVTKNLNTFYHSSQFVNQTSEVVVRLHDKSVQKDNCEKFAMTALLNPRVKLAIKSTCAYDTSSNLIDIKLYDCYLTTLNKDGSSNLSFLTN